jgi:hypothetical protein
MQQTGTVSQRDIFDTFDTWLASHKIQDLRTETETTRSNTVYTQTASTFTHKLHTIVALNPALLRENILVSLSVLCKHVLSYC